MNDLEAAIADLGNDRRPFAAAYAQQRDLYAADGQYDRAAFAAAISAALLDSADQERALIDGLDFTPGVGVVAVERPGECPDGGVE